MTQSKQIRDEYNEDDGGKNGAAYDGTLHGWGQGLNCWLVALFAR
jgi:hypothetical protein